jgi:hypothetical protein
MTSNTYRTIFFDNLILLGFNIDDPLSSFAFKDDAIVGLIGPVSKFSKTFFTSGHPQTSKFVELIIYFLLYKYATVEELDARFKNSWPIIDRNQAREFRLTVFKWLEELKKNDPYLASLPGFIIRKSFLDDPKSERWLCFNFLFKLLIMLVSF